MIPGTMIILLDKIRYLNSNGDLMIQRNPIKNPSTTETMLLSTFVYPSARNSLVITIKKYLNR